MVCGPILTQRTLRATRRRREGTERTKSTATAGGFGSFSPLLPVSQKYNNITAWPAVQAMAGGNAQLGKLMGRSTSVRDRFEGHKRGEGALLVFPVGDLSLPLYVPRGRSTNKASTSPNGLGWRHRAALVSRAITVCLFQEGSLLCLTVEVLCTQYRGDRATPRQVKQLRRLHQLNSLLCTPSQPPLLVVVAWRRRRCLQCRQSDTEKEFISNAILAIVYRLCSAQDRNYVLRRGDELLLCRACRRCYLL